MVKSRFIVKPHVVSMMSIRFPQYQYIFTKDTRYFFRRESIDGIYEYVVFQRDGNAGAFYIDLATTYNPIWEGIVPYPLGKWASLAELVKIGRRGYIDALENWYFYRNSEELLHIILDEIAKDLARQGVFFFKKARNELKKDRVLQAGLDIIVKEGPIGAKALSKLNTDLEHAEFKLADTNNDSLDEMIHKINQHPKLRFRFNKNESYVRKVACDLLYYSREIAGKCPDMDLNQTET